MTIEGRDGTERKRESEASRCEERSWSTLDWECHSWNTTWPQGEHVQLYNVHTVDRLRILIIKWNQTQDREVKWGGGEECGG